MNIIKRLFVKILLLLNIASVHNEVPILLYHRITCDDLDKRIAFATLDQFKQQMTFLKKKGYKTITSNELYNILTKKNKIPHKTFIITFDDGFRDNLDAIKFANNLGFSTIVFVSTDFIGKSYNEIPYKGNRSLGFIERVTLKPLLIEYLTVNEIKSLTKMGNEVFPHTMSHVCLTYENKDEQKRQILGSREVLNKITGLECNSFSYPYGIYTDDIINLLKENGFKCAFSVDVGTNKKNIDLYKIKRHNVCNVDNLSYFKLLLTNKYTIYAKLSDKLRSKKCGK